MAFTLFAVLAFSTGCSEEAPDVIRVGLLPDQSAEELRKRYDPIFDRVAATARIRYELVIPGSYKELVELFDAKKVDIAYFGALTFAKTQKQSNARPLVMRDVDKAFKSTLLVSAANPITSIEDLKGQSFSFGSRLSTSGHLMPRHFLAAQGIDPENFFSDVSYSGAHDKTALAVQTGKVAAGILNSEIANRMFEKGDLDPSRVRIFSETPPYPNYVWAISGSMSEDLEHRLREGFLQLGHSNTDDQRLLKAIGAEAFLPAHKIDFVPITEIAISLGLL